MPLTALCEICETAFTRPPSRMTNGRGRFCSMKCKYIFKSTDYKEKNHQPPHYCGKNNNKYNHDLLEKPCPICGIPFRSVLKTCSKNCGEILRRQTISGANNPFSRLHPEEIKTCTYCGNLYSRSGRSGRRGSGKVYCSLACNKMDAPGSFQAKRIVGVLNELGYLTEQEKTWSWLISPLSIYPMRIDIYISQFNIAIEYDGRQHFEPAFGQGEEGLKKIKLRDMAKNHLLKENNIQLYRLNKDSNMVEFFESLVAQHGDAATKKRVRAAIKKKYPDMLQNSKKKSK